MGLFGAVGLQLLVSSYLLAIIGLHHKYSCSSAISTLQGKGNKRRLQTLSIDNAWSNKNFLGLLDVSYATTRGGAEDS